MVPSLKMMGKDRVRAYLFYDREKEEKIINKRFNYIFVIFAVIMFSFALYAAEKDICAALFFTLCGLNFFPVIPVILKYYKKAYYVELMDDYIACGGTSVNLFVKKKINYEDVFYIEKGRIEPDIYPRGTLPQQMVKQYGAYVNVYSKDKKYLFSFRSNPVIYKKLLEKNPNVKIVKILDDYSF